MSFDATRAGILDRLSPDGQKASLGKEILQLSEQQQALQAALEALSESLAKRQRFFARTAIVRPANAATRVHVLAQDELAETQTAYPLHFFMVLSGETLWSGGTGTRIFLVDSGTDLVYRFAETDPRTIAPGAYITPESDGVTLEAEFTRSLGGRAGKGIDIVADGNFEAGSELSVTVYGYIA
jgi:hypothetical protein